MNLIEAVNSGKPFKRKITYDWYSPEKTVFGLSRKEILATDWEIQEPTVTITRSQFDEAISKAWEDGFNLPQGSYPERLAKELGL